MLRCVADKDCNSSFWLGDQLSMQLKKCSCLFDFLNPFSERNTSPSHIAHHPPWSYQRFSSASNIGWTNVQSAQPCFLSQLVIKTSRHVNTVILSKAERCQPKICLPQNGGKFLHSWDKAAHWSNGIPSKLFRPLHEAGLSQKTRQSALSRQKSKRVCHRAQDGAPPVKVPQQY